MAGKAIVLILLAIENKIKTIAFLAISTGVYGFPLERATNIAVKTVKDFVSTNSNIDEVIFVCFDKRAFDIYQKIMKQN